MALTISSSAVTTAVGVIAATYIFLQALLRLTQDSREPPAVLKTVPFISPILGMGKWSKDFYSHMRNQYHHLPVFTLRLPGTRIYAINTVDLIPVVQRQWRTLIFAPIQVKAAQAGMGVSKESIAILNEDLVTEKGFINGMVKATHPTMSNGPALDALNTKAFEVLNESLEDFGRAPRCVDMYEWIGQQIMRATTDAVYGPANPMKEAHNLEAWHKYHPALMYIILDILPQKIFFKTAVTARQSLIDSFAKYYTSGSYKQGSAYIRAFTEHCIAHKIPAHDIPCMLVGTVFNNVANTVPSAFWVLYRIFSDSQVLSQCREEVQQAVQYEGDIATIDLSYILSSCPILLSTYHEVFRFHGMANSVRVVSEDHLLDGKHLLKKGGLVMMSARTQHSNPAVWGDDVAEFNHLRFVKDRKKRNPAAFRGFGGGVTLCPGRHFATSEILLLAALLMLRFEVQPIGENGDEKEGWTMPSTEKSSQAEAMEQPDEDVRIRFVPRPEVEGKKWRITSSGRRDAELLVQK